MADLVGLVMQWTIRVAAAAWAVFLLSWTIGWLIRGMPLPMPRLKRYGQGIIEDAVWAAFWLAVGISVFAFIYYLAQMLGAKPIAGLPFLGNHTSS